MRDLGLGPATVQSRPVNVWGRWNVVAVSATTVPARETAMQLKRGAAPIDQSPHSPGRAVRMAERRVEYADIESHRGVGPVNFQGQAGEGVPGDPCNWASACPFPTKLRKVSMSSPSPTESGR